jgi:hypothetical protein
MRSGAGPRRFAEEVVRLKHLEPVGAAKHGPDAVGRHAAAVDHHVLEVSGLGGVDQISDRVASSSARVAKVAHALMAFDRQVLDPNVAGLR